MSMNLSDIVILNIKSAHYHCFISGISNIVAINLMQNAEHTESCHATFVIQKHMSLNKTGGCCLIYYLLYS